MPLYRVKCRKCGRSMEILYPQDKDRKCRCGESDWQRLPSAPNFKVLGGTEKFYDKKTDEKSQES